MLKSFESLEAVVVNISLFFLLCFSGYIIALAFILAVQAGWHQAEGRFLTLNRWVLAFLFIFVEIPNSCLLLFAAFELYTDHCANGIGLPHYKKNLLAKTIFFFRLKPVNFGRCDFIVVLRGSFAVG